MDTIIRQPVMAGRFYEAASDACAAEAARLCMALGRDLALPEKLVAAIVPHAGWVCSGRIAGGTFAALAEHTEARTFIITGSVHTMPLARPAIDSADAWRTPLGDVAVDDDLREAVANLEGFEVLDAAHRQEHSVEVNLPLMQAAIGRDIRVVPCMIPPAAEAAPWGEALGRLLDSWRRPVAMICSVDLTHYGPHYGLTPGGTGAAGRQWASANDQRLLDLVTSMKSQAIVAETQARQNSCGGGAIAATVAAAGTMGAQRGYLLEHTDSARELAAVGYVEEDNCVGYAGVVFG